MKNTGFEYEILVASIFQEILKQEFVENITVQQNVKLFGKSGTQHQIDVFWKFQIGGIFYSTIVQAKDWNSFVKQEQVLAFKSVLDDLPMQPRGIIITKKGFQKGAKIYAESHGIELFELKKIPEPKPTALAQGSFVTLYANLQENCLETVVYPLKYRTIEIVVKRNFEPTIIDRHRKSIYESFINSTIMKECLYDQNFSPITTFGKFIGECAGSTHNEAKILLKKEKVFSKNFSRKFESPTYLFTKNKCLPFLEVEQINFTVEVTKREVVKIPFSKPGVSTFVLKNIFGGIEKKFELKELNTANL